MGPQDLGESGGQVVVGEIGAFLHFGIVAGPSMAGEHAAGDGADSGCTGAHLPGALLGSRCLKRRPSSPRGGAATELFARVGAGEDRKVARNGPTPAQH